MKRVSDVDLDILIEGLEWYKKKGVIDPWVINDGKTFIEPLDVLKELRELRLKLELI